MKTFLQNLWLKKRFRVMCWNIFNALITGAIAYFTEIPAEWSAFVLMALNMLTKYINNKYFSDLGVPKATV